MPVDGAERKQEVVDGARLEELGLRKPWRRAIHASGQQMTVEKTGRGHAV